MNIHSNDKRAYIQPSLRAEACLPAAPLLIGSIAISNNPLDDTEDIGLVKEEFEEGSFLWDE